MSNLYRRNVILELLRAESVATQAELVRRLARRGIHVTQATISRDIEELGLAKTREGYRLPGAVDPKSSPQPAIEVVLKEFVREVRAAANLAIVKTTPGNAHSVGVAIDAAGWPEIVGTVAGDDTIFVATRGVRQAARVRRKVLDLLAS
jgi:transcriptional regulator of arginine metabolism